MAGSVLAGELLGEDEIKPPFTEEDYKKAKDEMLMDGLTGFIGFAMSFGGKWFAGYRRDVAGTKGCLKNMKTQTRRSKQNAIKQSKKLKGVWFICSNYHDLDIPQNSLIYCDPPCENTTKYKSDFNKFGVNVNYAGSGYKALVFTDLILEGQITSIIVSLIMIVLLLALMFKNFKVGLIGTLPIIITALIGFGVMGLLNIPLSTTTALISSIAIGIGIDYAVHFIERYKIYAAQTGDKLKTTQLTMHHSGRAIIFNAIVVIAGFMVLMFSVFPPNRILGALVSLNMFTSFLGTVTIMFVVLYVSNIYFKKEK